MCDFTGQYHVRCEQIIMLFELMGLLRNRPMFFIRTEHPPQRSHPYKKTRETLVSSTPQRCLLHSPVVKVRSTEDPG